MGRLVFPKKPSDSLRLEISRVIGSFYGGIHRSVLGGRGSEFKFFRPYEPADNLRDIDWSASAKVSENPDLEPVSRVYNPERKISVVLAIDLSPSMSFPSKKFEAALELLWLFFISAFRYRDRTRLVFFGGDRIVDSSWLLDEGALEFFMEKHFCPYKKTPDCPLTDLASHLAKLRLSDPLFVLISDLSFDCKGAPDLFRRLDFQKRNINGLVFWLDEWEGFSPARHGIILKDPESGQNLRADMRRNSTFSKMAEKAVLSAQNTALGLRPAGLFFIGLPLVADTLFLAKQEVLKIVSQGPH